MSASSISSVGPSSAARVRRAWLAGILMVATLAAPLAGVAAQGEGGPAPCGSGSGSIGGSIHVYNVSQEISGRVHVIPMRPGAEGQPPSCAGAMVSPSGATADFASEAGVAYSLTGLDTSAPYVVLLWIDVGETPNGMYDPGEPNATANADAATNPTNVHLTLDPNQGGGDPTPCPDGSHFEPGNGCVPDGGSGDPPSCPPGQHYEPGGCVPDGGSGGGSDPEAPYFFNGTALWDGTPGSATIRLFNQTNQSRSRGGPFDVPGGFNLTGLSPGTYGFEAWIETDSVGGPGSHEPRGFVHNESDAPDPNIRFIPVGGNMSGVTITFLPAPEGGWPQESGGGPGGPGGPGGDPGSGGGWGCDREYDASTHATVRGYVKDARRQPASGTSMFFQNRDTDAGEGSATTNETGYYTCVVPGGSYQIDVWGSGGQAFPRFTAANGTETWLNFSLSYNARPPYDPPTDFFGGTVWGNITVGGVGVAGIRLNIFPANGPGAEPNPECNNWGGEPGQRQLTCYPNAETNADGAWVATGLRDGAYSMHIDGSAVGVTSEFVQEAFTVAGATTENEVKQDVGVRDFDAPAYIRGRVNTTGDAPVEFANVQAYPHCGGPTAPGESCGSFGWATTDENGEYTIIVGSGRYGMSASVDSGLYQGPPLSSDRRDCHDGPDARCVLSSAGNTTWVNFTLRPGHVLSGQVVKQVDGVDVPIRANIQADSCGGMGACRFAWGQTAWNNSGWFSLTLDPGTYNVRVEPDRFEEPDLGVYTTTVTVPEEGDVHLGVVRLGQAGFIEGTVTGPDGEPLAGVNVFANEHREPGDFGPGGFGGWAFTDETGHYRLAGLRTGSYDVNFEPPWGSGYMRQRNESVAVAEGDVTTVHARLSDGGVLAGYVLRADGTGVEDAWVDAWWMPVHMGPGGHEEFPTSGGYGNARTDANGYYAIRGLTEGTFGMYVRPPFDSSLSSASVDPMSGDVPSVSVGATTWRNFTLSAGASIRGCVQAPTGDEAIPFAWVSAFSQRDGFGGGEPTGFDGCFNLRGVRPGTYDLDVNPPFGSAYGRTVVSGVVVTEGEDVDLGIVRLRAGVQLSGRVLDADGEGVANVFVNVFQQHEEGPSAGPGAFGFAQTDADGSFVIRGLVAGRYGMHVQPGFGSGLSSKFVQDIRIPDEGLSNYEVRLGGGGWITGTVLGPDGQPLRFAWVGAWSHDGGSGSGGITGDDGSFNLSGLTPATDYNFDVFPPYGGQELAGYHQFPLQVNESQGTLPGPARDGLIQLSRGGSLVGRLVDEAGAGVSNAFVNVGGESTFGWGMSDEDGNFTVRGLNAQNGDSLHVFVQPGFGSSATPLSTQITWAADADTGVMDAGELVLSAGKNFSGTVTRSGTPVADVDVHVWPSLDEDGRPMGPPGGGSATTDDEGNFTVRGLPAGYYDISIQPRDGTAGRFIPRGVLIASANDTTGFALTLEAGGDLPVLVVQAGTSTGIADAQVDCFNPDLHAGRGNRTGGDGRTTLQGLPAGTYQCRAMAPGYQPTGVDATVASGSNAELTIELGAVSTSTLTGTYSNGSASSGYFVIVAPADDDIGSGDATGFNSTASDGAFVIPHMPYGTYDVKVVSPAGVLVARLEGVVVDEATEALGSLTYDPTLGG